VLKSPSVKIHILRGVLGFAFLGIALSYSSILGWWTIAPAVAALLCFGGCPMCWIVGFAGTILGNDSTSLCLDGSCAKQPSGHPTKPS